MSTTSFGVTYPAGLQARVDLRAYVEHTEALGYDGLWVIENFGTGAPGYECLTLLSYAAACSKHLTLGTSVLLLPLRNPVLLAQAMTTVDQLSGGRLVLGVGVGGEDHHAATGSDPRTRGARCEEYLQLLTELMGSETPVSFDGNHVAVTDYELLPRSVQKPQVPVWVGGHADKALDRAARLAQGVIPVGLSPSACAALYAKLDTQTEALGRPSLSRAAHVYLCLSDSEQQGLRTTSEVISVRFNSTYTIASATPHFIGTVEQCRAQLSAFLNAGVNHFIIDPGCALDETPAQIERFKREVIDAR